MAQNEFVDRLIGNSLGQTIEVDLEEGEVEWGEYMIIWVKIDIWKP